MPKDMPTADEVVSAEDVRDDLEETREQRHQGSAEDEPNIGSVHHPRPPETKQDQ